LKLKNEGEFIDFYVQKHYLIFKEGETKDLPEEFITEILQRFPYWRFRMLDKDIATIRKTSDAVIITLKSGKEIIQKKPEELRFLAIEKKINKSKIQIAIFMKNITTHYSGGRYWGWLLGHILAQDKRVQVTFVTNELPPFGKSFESYKNSNIFVYIDKIDVWNMGQKIPRNFFDYVIGIPIEGGVSAQQYAGKWSMPYYLLLFESPNFIRAYRDGPDASDTQWQPYKAAMIRSHKVINNTEIGKQFLDDWMSEDWDAGKSVFLWNSINAKVADAVHEKEIRGEVKHIVFVGRAMGYKRIVHIIRALNLISNMKFVFHLISGNTNEKERLEAERKSNVQIEFHAKVDDYEKFKIIKRCNMMVFLSAFEGFGIPPMEALYCSRVCIAYPLPILKLIYKGHLVYTEAGNIPKLAETIKKWLPSSPEKKNHVIEAKKYIDTVVDHKRVQREFFDIMEGVELKELRKRKEINITQSKRKLSFGMILCNGEQFLAHNLSHIYPIADEIIIIEGAVEHFASVLGSYTSTDKSLKIIKDFINEKDPAKKIRLISSADRQKPWRDKVEMQNVMAEHTRGEFFVKQDVDEFYDLEGLLLEIERLERDKKLMINYRSHHFWGDMAHVIVGANFNDKQTRIWKWKDTYRHIDTFNVFTNTETGHRLSPNPVNAIASEDTLFHYSYLYTNRTRKMVLEYYANRQIGDHADVRQAWLNRDIRLLRQGRTVKEIQVKHPLEEDVLQEFMK